MPLRLDADAGDSPSERQKLMGLFSLFSRTPEKNVIKVLTDRIVLASLESRKISPASSDLESALVGAELAFFLLNLVDREAFRILGVAKRNSIFRDLSRRVISGYLDAVLKQNTPTNLQAQLKFVLFRVLNSRQVTYSTCKSFFDSHEPSALIQKPGTMEFAYCFFVQRAPGRTDRNDVDDLLSGKRSFEQFENKDIPDIEYAARASTIIMPAVLSLRLFEELLRLK